MTGEVRAMPCPRCGALVAPNQDWCLDCGAAARTRIAKTPRWRTPVVVVASLGALSLGVLGFAFADLTADAGRLAPSPTTTNGLPPATPAVTTTPPPGASTVIPPTTGGVVPDPAGTGATPALP